MGGAAGHMAHPYDLAWVNTGDDLVRFFELAKDVEGTVKIDGVNVSFKVVGEGDNKQFAVDRGSLQVIDIEGVTIDRVEERFPREGHGMRRMVPNLLNILNEALPSVKGELESFGMWEDPSRFLNTEYVEGITNVTAYDKNFLAIHGLNQFYQKIGKVGKAKGVERPGVDRPEGVTAPSVEISYNDQTMESFVRKVNAIAENYGFEVISEAQVRRMEDAQVDFSEALARPLTINISEDQALTKPLSEWLSQVTNPRYKLIKGADGKTYNALHRELYYKLVEEGIPVTELIDQADAQDAIYGAVMVHAVRTLGNVLLSASTSDLGDLTSHEGIVLRNKRKFKTSNPVKITGEFILGNLGGGFGTMTEDDDAIELDIVADDEVAAIEDEDADPVGAGTVAIVPGAFKPPHAGHAEMVRAYAEEADRVIVLISKPTLRGRTLPDGTEVTAKHSKDIWDIMIGDLPNVEVYISDHASPINAAYAAVGKPEDRENAARNWENGPIQPGSNVILGASTKDGDAQRWTGAEQYVGDDLNLVPPMQSAVVCTDRMCGTAYSATDFRRLLGDPEANREELEEFVGAENLDAVLAALGLGANLEEISTTANVAGAVGARGGPWSTEAAAIKKDNKEEKERSKLVTRSLGIAENKQTVDEVIRLLMERGIMT